MRRSTTCRKWSDPFLPANLQDRLPQARRLAARVRGIRNEFTGNESWRKLGVDRRRTKARLRYRICRARYFRDYWICHTQFRRGRMAAFPASISDWICLLGGRVGWDAGGADDPPYDRWMVGLSASPHL